MKPLAHRELFSLVSFFLKEHKIEVSNHKYINFFLHDFKEPGLSNKQAGSVESIKLIPIDGSGENRWTTISAEDIEFYLSRLSPKMSSTEKHCILALLLKLCKQNNVFQPKPLLFVENSALQFGVNSNVLSTLKKITLLVLPSISQSNIDDNLLLLQENNLIDISNKISPIIVSVDSPQVLAYVCVSQEQIAFIKTSSEKAAINGCSIASNKVYPIMEGDVLQINETQLTFNELFHHYYSALPFPKLQIESTENTPSVNFDPKKNHLELTGSSIPEDGIAFFQPMLKWLDSYLMTLPDRIEVKIQLDYFNTTSSKFILDIFKRLESYKKDNIELIVNWYFAFGDDDLEEAGLYYSEIVKIPFAIIPYN